MIISHVPYYANIYIAGDYNDAKRICKEYCVRGACVTVQKCEYIYTGGSEPGVVVGFVNYPRFPSSRDELVDKALALATLLRQGLFQDSFLIQTPDQCYWDSLRSGETTPPSTHVKD